MAANLIGRWPSLDSVEFWVGLFLPSYLQRELQHLPTSVIRAVSDLVPTRSVKGKKCIFRLGIGLEGLRAYQLQGSTGTVLCCVDFAT